MFRWIFIALLTLSTLALSHDCDNQFRDDSDAAAALSYLRQERQNLDNACIARAIRIIGLRKYSPAMSTLIEYLDFEMSRPVVLRYSQGPTNGIYPAADALSRFGESSVTALKNALDDDASGQIRRINAAKVLFAVVDNKPEAIRAIAKAGFILGIKVMRML